MQAESSSAIKVQKNLYKFLQMEFLQMLFRFAKMLDRFSKLCDKQNLHEVLQK